ncbi:DUF418 domain-containing protein [Salsuginibacillus kocurii]|uniref:DUF418 domain-containing protein n=1 Tax=Salsuginibacillus kocurii TaxID=427078 RepID=UPI00037FDFCE|nr:DUF418 domain-containing protein [Salsuginibacillus kocurii]
MSAMKSGNQIQRIEILDQMRGLALLAIFLVNIPSLSAAITTDTASIISTNDVVNILLNESARPLFAFMFGISLILIYDRLKDKGINPYPTLFRRMLLLFFVGAVHGYLIWSGDILLLYASAGFVLLLFVSLSRTWLLLSALLFWLGYTVGKDLLGFYTAFDFSLEQWLLGWFGSGEKPMGTEHLMGEFSSVVTHLGFFLFGMYAYRMHIFSAVEKRKMISGVLATILLAVGLSGKTALYYNVDSVLVNGLDVFYQFLVTLGMVLIIVLLGATKTIAAQALVPFTAIGKMAFTNYLMQSLVFVSLFSLSGQSIFEELGLWTEPSYYFALGLGISLFIVQMIFSHLWLKMFYYGPLEWIWRIGTHGRYVALRRKN